MKTAEELGSLVASFCDDPFCFNEAGAREALAKEQLDAFKAGAKWAAGQVYGTPERPSYPEDVNYRSGMKWMKEAVEKRILTAAEQLTKLP